ncbi:MAG: tRNA (adenosine(37)-N6)-threonylcarbamoyltransferase complex ATPase subunit type 1 TsaE [Planctomycetes bacterium]|nr:tRNA (adenosine(37)-N6)-threonylcarbamoyltransferase complex ATPase subunit type 1 TsaE [Planctomycetota bacterium]
MRLATLRSESPADTAACGRRLGAAIDPVPPGGLFVVLLGDLGAGKTVFAGGLVRGLGAPADVPVVSPTFTLARAYRGRAAIVHVDAYLVRRIADLEAAGFEDMGGDGRVTVVEWGDRIAAALPADRLEVTLTPVDDPTSPGPARARRVELRAGGPRSEAVLDRFLAAAPAGLEPTA